MNIYRNDYTYKLFNVSSIQIIDEYKGMPKEDLLQIYEEKLRQMLNSRKITSMQLKEFNELKQKILKRMN